MKSNELRIGNLIKLKERVQKEIDASDNVHSICAIEEYEARCIINKLEYAFNYSFIEPIPLTEEWLIKFGFSYDGISFVLPNNKFMIGHYKNNVYALVNGFDISLTVVEIKHVHQLQNLYFTLTGEELIIKPN